MGNADAEGCEGGRKGGRKEGRKEGREEGRKEGRKERRKEGRKGGERGINYGRAGGEGGILTEEGCHLRWSWRRGFDAAAGGREELEGRVRRVLGEEERGGGG